VGLLQVHMKQREKGLVPPELYLLSLKLGSVTPPLCTKVWSIWEGVYMQACMGCCRYTHMKEREMGLVLPGPFPPRQLLIQHNNSDDSGYQVTSQN